MRHQSILVCAENQENYGLVYRTKTKNYKTTAEIARDADVGAHSLSL